MSTGKVRAAARVEVHLPPQQARPAGAPGRHPCGVTVGGLTGAELVHQVPAVAIAVGGLLGSESASPACSSWRIDALVLAGRRDEPSPRFDRLLTVRNDVGLLSGEYDTGRRRLVGNASTHDCHFRVGFFE